MKLFIKNTSLIISGTSFAAGEFGAKLMIDILALAEFKDMNKLPRMNASQLGY